MSVLLSFQLIILLCRKPVDDIVYEVDCAMVVVKAGADVDIGEVSWTLFILHILTSCGRRQPIC